MIKVLYEDQHMIVVVKPAGVESQAAKKLFLIKNMHQNFERSKELFG